jgi:predicted PurR-regulated permease PerM
VVQYLEANLIFPYVVGKKVNVNILVSIVSVFAGGFLWGVSGMVLFLPLVAVLKVISDESDQLKPLSILLSEK